MMPSINPPTDEKKERNSQKKLASMRLSTVRNGTITPNKIITNPIRIIQRGLILSIAIKPTGHIMFWGWFKFNRVIDIAQSLHDMRAARMIAASRRWVYQAGWLPSRDFFIRQRILCVRFWAGSQKCLGIGMLGVIQDVIHFGFFVLKIGGFFGRKTFLKKLLMTASIP